MKLKSHRKLPEDVGQMIPRVGQLTSRHLLQEHVSFKLAVCGLCVHPEGGGRTSWKLHLRCTLLALPSEVAPVQTARSLLVFLICKILAKVSAVGRTADAIINFLLVSQYLRPVGVCVAFGHCHLLHCLDFKAE